MENIFKEKFCKFFRREIVLELPKSQVILLVLFWYLGGF